MPEGRSILVVLTTGKEALVRANAVLQLTGVLQQHGTGQVELLFLGPGIEVLRANQRNSPQFAEQLDGLRRAGVQVAACRNSLENLGLTEDQMLPATVVQGGVEVATRIAEGWEVLTF
ncbi:DsrE family protein [Aciditerrimonas ferrireducens]|jgi:hypothetical protein|uniref:DsrE family protein n=1 Tax=Aciditerrimonas ferrireducens TaxID=667306 RepID=A0ABV6C170_9ACTN